MRTLRILAKRVVVIVLGLAALLLIGGVATEAIARNRVAQRFPLPGQLFDIGGRRMQMDCRGSGSPTVVLESGLDILGSLAWAAVHDSLATTTRTCAYSRAGIMWSDPSPEPFSSSAVARDLHATLRAAGESMPVVLVAHSLGGPYALEFTRSYGADVAGLVLVDASHPDQVARQEKVTGQSMAQPTGMLTFAALMARTGLVRALAGDVGPPSAAPHVRQASAAYTPKSVGALARETKSVSATLEASSQGPALGARPLVVLTATKPMPAWEREMLHLTIAQADALRSLWKEMQAEEAAWSTRGRQQLVDAGHYIQFERPDAVIAAVREVVSRVRP